MTSSTPDAPPQYQLGQQPQAQQNLYSSAQSFSNAPNYAANLNQNYLGGLSNYLQGTSYNPQDTVNQGNALYGQGANLYSAGNVIANTAFDPQSALYNRSQNQLEQQIRASEADRGIATTPYGASVESNAMGNFNIDWQNQQLQRQIQGGQAMGGLYGQGANMQLGGAGLAAGVPGSQIGQYVQLGSSAGNAYTQPLAASGLWSNYVGQGTQSNQAATNAYNAQNQANQASTNSMIGAMSGIGKLAGTALTWSDRRLKEDIDRVGETDDGLVLYSYRYKGQPEVHIGMMADEVERVRPEAVVDIGGYKAVNYKLATGGMYAGV